jgi:adenylate kinase
MMSTGACILVFGVSGVGKTSSCKAYVEQHPDFLYVRVSELLSRAVRIPADQLRGLAATKALANQKLIEPELSAFRSGQWHRPVLVDSHAVVDTEQGLMEVPVEVVAALSPAGLVLLEAPVTEVLARRTKSDRTYPVRCPAEVEAEIKAERAAVLHYAASLKIRLEIGTNSGVPSFEEVLEVLLRAAERGD